MALLQNVVAKGTHAARPSAGSAGVLYYETDTYGLFRDNGTSWDQIAWPSTPAAVRAYNSGNISINDSTVTALPLDSTRFDQGTATAQHSTSGNTSRLTCQIAGVYQITGLLRFNASGSSADHIAILRLNGTTEIGRFGVPLAINIAPNLCVTSLWSLSVSDYVELCAYQTTGGALNVQVQSGDSPELMWVRVA